MIQTLYFSLCLPHWLYTRLLWEETLLDSLLNFAATPKGLLLLQQTGAINECVSHMFSRFTKKLQVITNTQLYSTLLHKSKSRHFQFSFHLFHLYSTAFQSLRTFAEPTSLQHQHSDVFSHCGTSWELSDLLEGTSAVTNERVSLLIFFST